MRQINLGHLQKVNDLRLAWETEAGHFTPWLAQEKNLAYLAETIGLELELEETEKSVGAFRADIIAKDTLTDTWVLIENQLEHTDHSHLGQILTYAAGLDAVTIVWIAYSIREEHRAALDWLNEVTEDSINFFGLEIELWRIGSSPIAPKFNIVSKPNDWTKTVKAVRQETSEISPVKQLQLQYWRELMAKLETRTSNIKARKPRAQHWMYFSVGRSGFRMSALTNMRDRLIAIQLIIDKGDIEAYFELLHEQKSAIEAEIGEELQWRRLPDKKRSDITLYNPRMDPNNQDKWNIQHDWILKKLEAFYQAFSPRIRRLDPDHYQPEEELDFNEI